jgi:hypothetical protein
MNSSKKMAKVISALAQQRSVDLTQVGAYIKFENDPWMPLSVEVIGQHLVSVTQYSVQSDVLHERGNRPWTKTRSQARTCSVSWPIRYRTCALALSPRPRPEAPAADRDRLPALRGAAHLKGQRK